MQRTVGTAELTVSPHDSPVTVTLWECNPLPSMATTGVAQNVCGCIIGGRLLAKAERRVVQNGSYRYRGSGWICDILKDQQALRAHHSQRMVHEADGIRVQLQQAGALVGRDRIELYWWGVLGVYSYAGSLQ